MSHNFRISMQTGFQAFFGQKLARQCHINSHHSSSVFQNFRTIHHGGYPRQWMNDYCGLQCWTEDLSKYERGIYFAVHLGDVLGDGRYKVLHKLGNGSFSQIWLAKDQNPRFDILLTSRISKVPQLNDLGVTAT